MERIVALKEPLIDKLKWRLQGKFIHFVIGTGGSVAGAILTSTWATSIFLGAAIGWVLMLIYKWLLSRKEKQTLDIYEAALEGLTSAMFAFFLPLLLYILYASNVYILDVMIIILYIFFT